MGAVLSGLRFVTKLAENHELQARDTGSAQRAMSEGDDEMVLVGSMWHIERAYSDAHDDCATPCGRLVFCSARDFRDVEVCSWM